MTTYDEILQCVRRVHVADFKCRVLGLYHIFCTEVPIDGGRLMLVRDGENGPLVGYREDYLDGSAFFLK